MLGRTNSIALFHAECVFTDDKAATQPRRLSLPDGSALLRDAVALKKRRVFVNRTLTIYIGEATLLKARTYLRHLVAKSRIARTIRLQRDIAGSTI